MAIFTCVEESIYFDPRELEKGTFTNRDQPFSSPPRFNINFKFSYQTRNLYFLQRRSGQFQLVRTTTSPMITKLTSLNLQQFLSFEEAHKTLLDAIKDWPVLDENRQHCLDFAWREARKAVISMSPRHNNVNLHFCLVMSKKNVFYYETNAIHMAIQALSRNYNDNMIPAVESSIESLEKKKMMESGTCSICMEEFSCGCEGLSMPCSHVFHGDCIKKWLRTSHYCPNCRLEMPTS